MRSPGSRWRALRIVTLCFGVQRGLTMMFAGCAIASGLSAPALTIAIGALASAVISGDGAWLAFAIVGALYLVQRLLAPLQQAIGDTLGRRVDESLSERLMVALSEPAGLAHVEDPAMLDAIAKAQGTLVGVTPGGAVTRLAGVWIQRLQGGASLVIVGAWRWWAAVVLLAACTLAFVISRWHWLQVTEIIYGRSDELRRSHYLRKLALAPALAKETRVFGLATWLVERHRAGWLAAMREVWRRRHEGWFAAIATLGLVGAVEGAILVAVAGEATSDELSLGRAVAVAVAVAAAGTLVFFHDGHLYVAEAADALARLETLERDVGTASGVLGGTASADELPRRKICFEGVRFGYPGRDAPVFAALDLEIEAGRSLAIVGENGAGKTTFVKLLARLYDPDAGRITVDGVDLRELSPRSWHRRIAAIFQDFTQFELSAEDNVAFGAVDLLRDPGARAAIERAAEQAGAGAVIARLAAGWDTPLSRELKGGTQLSGGEWQRLALARALFAVQAGAGVLVLDEPTASLDVRGEAEVYERFLELTTHAGRGVTTIVISHRFSTVRRADRIVVLEHGRVVEDGRHDELVAAGGRYAAMYALQASRFDDAKDADADA